MMYEVGERVRIRQDLSPGSRYGEYLFVELMLSHIDQEATIVKKYQDFYRLDVDNRCWKWTDEMFSGYAVENDDSIENFEFDVSIMLGV